MSTRRANRLPSHRRGGALLAVLWLSAALAAIVFSVSNTVRGEADRSSTLSESIRAQYLAAGAIDLALFEALQQGITYSPDGRTRSISVGASRRYYPFATGEALVEFSPETARLSLNKAEPPELFRLLMALGVDEGRAQEIAAAIVDWRTQGPPGSGLFDQFYLQQSPSFRARKASFEEVEEVLFVKGMTPEIFHGGWRREPDGRLVRVPGLKHCVSVYGTTPQVDVNTAEAPVLLAIGVLPQAVEAILQMRRTQPIDNPNQLAAIRNMAGPAGHLLRIGGNTIYTVSATARVRMPDGRLSEVRRSAAATVKFMDRFINRYAPDYRVLRWYEQPGREIDWWQ